jgi:hypothetical protein
MTMGHTVRALGRTAVCVAAAGVAGTLLNAVAAAVVVAPSRIALAGEPGRYGVAILVAALLPLLRIGGPAWRRLAAALAVLTLVPSMLAEWVFQATAPWPLVMILNAVYAAGAVAAFSLLDRRLPPARPQADPPD